MVVVLLLSQMHKADSVVNHLPEDQTPVKIGDRRCRRGPRLVPVVMTELCNAALVKMQVNKWLRLESVHVSTAIAQVGGARGVVADAECGGSASDKKRADGQGYGVAWPSRSSMHRAVQGEKQQALFCDRGVADDSSHRWLT